MYVPPQGLKMDWSQLKGMLRFRPPQGLKPVGWLIDGYTFLYRRKITITELSGVNLTDYPIRIDLDATNFDFTHFLNEGKDLRFTDINGNLLHHWSEKIDITNQQATIWVKVTSISANSVTEIYMYYGSEAGYYKAPPITSFTGGSIILEDPTDPGLLAEDIVWDANTNKWWLIFNDRTVLPWGIGFAYADNIEGPYTRDPYVYQLATRINAPSILHEKVDGYWYIFFGWTDDGVDADIYCIKSTQINSGYSAPIGPLVTRGAAGTWNSRRSCEPFVMRIPDYNELGLPNEYVMVFMGDAGDGTTEATGVAWAPHPEGPWTVYEGNPVLPIEATVPTGKWNAGVIAAADPFIFRYDNEFYVFVTGNDKYFTGVFKTTDFVNFKEYPFNPVLYGLDDMWRAFRGGMIEYNGYYYFSYTSYKGEIFNCALTKAEVYRGGKDPGLVMVYDDFERYPANVTAESGWDVQTSGFSTALEDTNKIFSKTGAESGALSIKYHNLTNFIIEAELKHLDTTKLAELTMRGNQYTAAYGYLDELAIYKTGVGKVASTPLTVDANTWYHVTFSRIGDIFKATILDKTLEWTDPSPVSTHNCGVRIGGTYTGAFDKIKIRNYIEPEPSIEIGDEE